MAELREQYTSLEDGNDEVWEARLQGFLSELSEMAEEVEGLGGEEASSEEEGASRGLDVSFEGLKFMGHPVRVDRRSHVSIPQIIEKIFIPFCSELISNLSYRFSFGDFFSAFHIFDLTELPRTQQECAGYGDKELNTLLAWLGKARTLARTGEKFAAVVDAAACRREWRSLRLQLCNAKYSDPVLSFHDAWEQVFSRFETSHPNICRLISLALLLPLTTAPVERGFSVLNATIKTKLRNSLEPDTCEALMLLAVSAPPLFGFEPQPGRQRGRPFKTAAASAIIQKAVDLFNSVRKRQYHTLPNVVRTAQ